MELKLILESILFAAQKPLTAAELAESLVVEGLAACVNRFGGLTSVYKWEGEMKSGTEVLLLIKTPADRCDALTRELADIHPYELPEIVAVPVTAGLPGYLDWVVEECRDPTAAGQAPATAQ